MRIALFKILFCIVILNSYVTGAFAQLLPIPDWAKDIGGTGESKASGLVVDKEDNVYIAGNFQEAITLGSGLDAVKLTSVGYYDVFVAKYTYDGQLLWATRFGGDNLDQTNTMAVDLNGNAYLACMTMSPSINSAPRAGSYDYNGQGQEALLVKIDNQGEFKWARKVGGSGDDAGHMATTDKKGNVIFVGYCGSIGVNLDGWILNSKGDSDGFIVKYDTDGNVDWAYTIGSTGPDEIYGVRVNSVNEIAITGYVSANADLNPKGPASPLNVNVQNYYLAKYTEDFDLIWFNTIAGPTNQSAGLAMNGSDEMYVNGTFTGSVAFGSTNPANAISLNSIGTKDLYITKYGIDGDLKWTRRMKGNSTVLISYNIVADLDDNVYVTGYFQGTLEFGDAPNNRILADHGDQDTFFGKYDSQGNFIWAFNIGSFCQGNFGHKIAVDSKKNVFLAGRFCNTVNFNPSSNCALNLTAQHYASDAFIVKYNQVKLMGAPIVTSFTLAEQTANAQIDVLNRTIAISVHPGTDLTKLKPNISVDIGLTNPLSNTEQDFSTTKTYVVSSNCMDYNWTVKVTVARSQVTEICADLPFVVYGEVDNSPDPSFQWEVQDVDQDWIELPQPSTSLDYESAGISNFTGIDQVFKFRRRITSNGTVSYDSEVHITVYPSTFNNMISTTQVLNCNGAANITINGSAPQGAPSMMLTYKWQQSEDRLIWTEIENAVAQDFSPSEFLQTTWFRRITLLGDCAVYSNPLEIEVYEAATMANAGQDLELCDDNGVSLNANSFHAQEEGVWSVISPLGYNPFTLATINDPQARIDDLPANQDIVFRWTISNAKCSSSSFDEVTIASFKAPVVTLAAQLVANYGETVNLNAVIDPSTVQDYTFEWSPALGLTNAQTLNPSTRPTQSTTYTLKLYYGTSCFKTYQVYVLVVKDLEMPNAFSPNMDGINDVWTIKNIEGHPKAEVSIYNRYGIRLFYSSRYQSWDGMHKGSPVPVGIYYYIVKLNDDKKTMLKGSLTVIR